MVTSEARHEIDQLGPGPHALVVEWTDLPDLSTAATLASKRERLSFVESAFAEVKRAWLERFECTPGVEVEDLPGSAQAIVRASADRWRELSAAGGPLDQDRSIRVLPNRLYHALSPA